MKSWYYDEVTEDIVNWIMDNYNAEDYDNLDDFKEDVNADLYDTLFNEDSITGNMIGSYFYSRQAALDNLDFELLAEVIKEWGADFVEKGAEACDVAIRCYVLGECLDEALDIMEDKFNEYQEMKESEAV